MVTAIALLSVAAFSGSTRSAVADPAYDLITPTANYAHLCAPGPGGKTCQNDNAHVTFHVKTTTNRALEPVDVAVVKPVMFQEYGPGALVVRHRDTLVETGQAETDIVFEEGKSAIPEGYDGIAFCDDAVDGFSFRCDQHYVRIRGGGKYTPGLTCHEAGHAIGILHPEFASPEVTGGLSTALLGCSKKTVPPSATISPLERTNINHVYGS